MQITLALQKLKHVIDSDKVGPIRPSLRKRGKRKGLRVPRDVMQRRAGPAGKRYHRALKFLSGRPRAMSTEANESRKQIRATIYFTPLVVPEDASIPVSNSHTLPRRKNKVQRET